MSKKQLPEPTATQSFQPIKLNLIERSKTNPRKYFDETHLTELAESIKKHGVLQAILLRPFADDRSGKTGKFEIVAGERRYRAAKLAGLTEIPANVRTLDDKETLEIQVIENLQRSDLSPMEEAQGGEMFLVSRGKRHPKCSRVNIASLPKSITRMWVAMPVSSQRSHAPMNRDYRN